MNIKKLAVAAAVMSIGAAGHAQAGALATGLLTISNFALGTSTGGGFTAFTNTQFSSLTINDNATNTATLNGVSTAQFANSSVLGAPVNAALACVGVGCVGIGPNVFVGTPPAPLALFSKSDSNLQGTPITIVAPSTPAGVLAQTIAETSLPANGNGSAGSQINLTSTLNFVLGTSISNAAISFTGADFLNAWTSVGSLPGTSAGANTAWSINLSGPSGTLISWTPDGTTGGNHIGLTELTDPCNLTNNVSASFNQQLSPVSCTGNFLAVANGVTLAAGVNYSLNIGHNSQSNAVSAVPEPASLALLGIGFFGFGFASLRKKSA